MSCGMDRPGRTEMPHGCGPGWQGRALAAVLRECYRRGLVRPTLEEVEIAALSVLPEPEGVDEEPRPPLLPGPRERWEEAIRRAAGIVHGILCHGPASGTAGGQILFTGGTLRAQVDGLETEQRVDMIWRRPGGALEAVLVFEESLANGRPAPVRDDWRCVLAAAVVRALYGQTPDVHAVWVSGPAARVARIPDERSSTRGSGRSPGSWPAPGPFGAWTTPARGPSTASPPSLPPKPQADAAASVPGVPRGAGSVSGADL